MSNMSTYNSIVYFLYDCYLKPLLDLGKLHDYLCKCLKIELHVCRCYCFIHDINLLRRSIDSKSGHAMTFVVPTHENQ